MTKMRVWAKRDNSFVLVYDAAQVKRLTKTTVPVYEDMSLKYSDIVYKGILASLTLASVNAFALMVIVIRLAL